MKKRRNALFSLSVLSLFGGLYTGRELFFNLTYMLGLILLISFFWAWASLRWVKLSRITRTRRTQVGRPLEEIFRVQNTSLIPKLWLEIRDYSDVPAHYASYVVNGLRGRESNMWRVQTVCQRRGRYQLGPMRLRTSDPFGLFALEKQLDATATVVVFPLTADIYDFALPQGILPGGDALRRRTHFVTTNAAGVRDYAPGDSFSRIHWRSSARRGRLIVKEFELDPLADVWIVADMSVFDQVSAEEVDDGYNTVDVLYALERRQEFTLPATTEEYVVTIAASLAQYFLRIDRSVGMLAYGQVNEVVQPDRGERQQNRILETLSVIRAEGTMPLEDVVTAEAHLFPRGSTIIVVTPTTRSSWAGAARLLKQRGMRVVSVLVDAESFGGRRSVAPLVPLLQGRGLGVYTVKKGDDLTAVLSHTR